MVDEADFSGWATKAGLKCTDGRTIMPDAFKHQDKEQVPLVWHHGHSEVKNILGYAVLEHRDEGIYAQGYFNATDQGKSAKTLVQHGDVKWLSIFANQLVEKTKQVFHGQIREVSLVLAGANPGARIDFVRLEHSDGEVETFDDEAVIHTGIELEYNVAEAPAATEEVVAHADDAEDTETVADVYESLDAKQKNVVDFMLNEAYAAGADSVEHSDASESITTSTENTTEENSGTESVEHSETTEGDETLTHQEGTTEMANVFNQDGSAASPKHQLTHEEFKTLWRQGEKAGSFRTALNDHLEHADYGIENIEFLFPDAKNVNASPDVISRRMEWVPKVLDAAVHSPFSRIKSLASDLTADEARAKGYVKGNLKKDEIIKLLKRVTLPTTVYKKQKLDRDDVVDIVDLDVVAWLKAEMQVMLKEELARAILVSDGREPDDEDKIDEDCIRPIAYEDNMYAYHVNLAANVTTASIEENIIRARKYYKGSGTPTLFTTEDTLTDLLLQKDGQQRRLYSTEVELAAALRVREIVAVEVMEDHPDLIGIMVNMADYRIGADKGGELTLFEDFDIDFNQQKYLLETRISGALTKPRSAVVITKSTGTVVTPTQPQYNVSTHVITIPSITGVVYKIDGVTKTGTVTITETTEVEAVPASGYTFPHNFDADWVITY